jgi:hypothetical protein
MPTRISLQRSKLEPSLLALGVAPEDVRRYVASL